MAKEKIERFVKTNKKNLSIVSVVLIAIFLMAGIIAYATTSDGYVVEIKDDGANNIAQDEISSVTKKIVSETTDSLTYELKISNLQAAYKNPEVAILIDTSKSMGVNDIDSESKTKAIQFVTELLKEVPGVRISISNNSGVKRAMTSTTVANYTTTINALIDGEGSVLSNGIDYAISSFSASETSKSLVIFSDATDSILDKLETATTSGIETYSILTNITNSEYESQNQALGKVHMISDIENFSPIYNRINKSLVNVKITDIFTNDVNEYFNFEIVTKAANVEVEKLENGYVLNIPYVKAAKTETITFKLTLKDNVAIDAAKTYREINTSDSMKIEYITADKEEQNYDMNVSPIFVICKKYSLTIQAVSEKSDKLPVTDLQMQVVGKVITGQDENGKDIEKTIYDQKLTTDSNGKIKIDDLKTLGDIYFEIKPIVDQIGYSETSSTQIIVHNDPTGVGTIWAESDTTEPHVDPVKRNITVQLPINVQVFDLKIETVDSNNSNIKLGDVEYRVIQPKLNSKYEMEALYGTTDVDGRLVLKPAVMTKDGTYEYILSQITSQEGYDAVGHISLYVTYENGKVTKFVHKYGENVTSELVSATEAKVVVGNFAQKDDTFKLLINLEDKQTTSKKIQGAIYDVELTRVSSAGEQITTSYKGNITNEKGQIELELPGQGNIRVRITEVSAAPGYAADSETKEIVFVRSEGTVQYVSAKNPIDINAIADSDANALVVNFQSELKTEQNRIQIHLLDNIERDINIPNVLVGLTRVGSSITYKEMTDMNGIANFIVADEEPGTHVYEIKILSGVPYGYLAPNLMLGTISVSFNDNRYIYEVGDLTVNAPYFETTYAMAEEGEFTYHTAYINIGLEPDALNTYNFQIKLVDTDNRKVVVPGAKYDITMESEDFVRKITGRLTDSKGMISTRLVGKDNITITVKETESIKGYAINPQTQVIELTKVGDAYKITHQEPNVYDTANGSYIGAVVSGKNVIYYDNNKQKSGDDTILNLYVNKKDTNNNLVSGVRTVVKSETLDGVDGKPLNVDFVETDENGYFEITGIKVHGEDLKNGERLDYLEMYEVDVNGEKVRNTDVKLKLTFRYNENKEIIEITNVEATWGNRLIAKREFSGYESQTAYESNVYLDVFTGYDDVGNFELDLRKLNKDAKVLPGAKYDVIITRLDATRLIRRGLEITDSVEFPGVIVAAGTVIEITEQEAPIGYGVNEFTQMLRIESVDELTGEIEVSLNGERANIASKDSYILDDGTLKTSVVLDLVDYELDTFKFGILAQDSKTLKPIQGYRFNITSDQGAQSNTEATNEEGRVTTLVGANYQIENYVVTYTIDTLKAADFYKKLSKPIQVKVVFDLNGEVVGNLTTEANSALEGYGTIWNIEATNTIDGNDIDIILNIETEDPLVVTTQSKDTITGATLNNVEYQITPSLNIPGTGTTKVEVGYVLPNGIQTYTLKQTNLIDNYVQLTDKQFKITYNANGDIETAESLSEGITVVSFKGKNITIKVDMEPGVPFVITNTGYFDGVNLQNAQFEITSAQNITKTATTNDKGIGIGYVDKLGNNETVRYTIKQTVAASGYATVEEFQVDVTFDENRNITNAQLIGEVNKYIEFVTVGYKAPSAKADIGYNNNNKGIVQIGVKNYPEVQFNIENVHRQDENIKLPGTIYEVTSTINTKDSEVITNEKGIGIANMDRSGFATTVRYTIKEQSPSVRYQSLVINPIIEVDFDSEGFIIAARVVKREDVTTTSLVTIVNVEDKLKLNIQIKSNPELSFAINKVDEETSEPLANVDFEVTARIAKTNLSNYSEEEIAKLTLNTSEITEEQYLAQVLDRLKIDPEDVEKMKQDLGLEKLINELKENNNLTEEEEDNINQSVNNSEKINKIIDLEKATATKINKTIASITNKEVVDMLIEKETTTQDRVNQLLKTVKDLVRLDVDNVTTDEQGQVIAYMDKTLANKTIEYTIKETRKAAGYDWLDEIIIIEVTYDATGKIIENDGVKVISGDVNVTNVDINSFKIDVTINNKPSDELRIHLTVEDVYDTEKKLETAEFDAFLVDTDKGVGFHADDKYRVHLASGTETTTTGKLTAHGEDTEIMGIYEEGAGNRILRLVQKATPDTYFIGNDEFKSAYQSIAYALLLNVSFDDEGRVTATSLYNPGGDSVHIGYIADSRYIEVSHTRNTINVTVRYYPMLQVQMQAVDMYTGDNLQGNFSIDTRAWGVMVSADEIVSAGYINPHFYSIYGYSHFGKTYNATYTTSDEITTIDEAKRVPVSPVEADYFEQNKNPNKGNVRTLYVYETAEPTKPIQYQTYLPRLITHPYDKLLAKIQLTYDTFGRVEKVEVLQTKSSNNIKDNFFTLVEAELNDHTVQITVKYAPITTITATTIDEVSKYGLSGIRIDPYVNPEYLTKQSYEYRTIGYYTTSNSGKASWTYWGASIPDSLNRYELNSYTIGSGYDGYFDPQNIILDVSYDENGRVSAVTPRSTDQFGDINAVDITWENNDIKVNIPYSRRFNTKINKVDFYDSNTILNATYKVISSEGANVDVPANKTTTIGKVYAGKTVKYTLSETTAPIGYVPVENLEYYVTFNNDGSVRNTEHTKPSSDSEYFEFIKVAPVDVNKNRVDKTDMEISIKNKPRFDVKIDLSDKFYPELKLEGALFNMENSKGDVSMGAVATDANGILETYIGPIYPNEEVTYTIRQANEINGYYPNEEVLQFKVKFNANAKIEEYTVIGTPENYSIQPEKYVNKKGVTIQMNNKPKDIKVGIYKYDELTTQVMGNIKFNVKTEVVNEKTSNINIITNDDGTIVGVCDTFVERTDYRTVNYTISEIEVPNSYRKIQDVVIQVIYNKDGSMYLYDVLSNESNVQVEVAVNKQIKFINETPVHIKLTIPNDNAYDLIIKNEDKNYEGLGIEGTRYDVTINGIIQNVITEDKHGNEIDSITTDVNGITKVENQTQVGNITIRISERQIGEGYRADSNNDVILELYKGEEEYSLSLNSNSNENYANVVVDEAHGTITVTFKNESKLELNLLKDDINTDKVLEGAVFEITEQEVDESGTPIEGTLKTITTDENNTTNTEGVLYFDLGIAKQNKTIEYTLTEITAPEGYEEIPPVKVKVTFDMYGRIINMEDDSFRAECFLDSDTGKSHNMIFNVANGAMDPQYTVKVISADSQTGTRINGSIFQVEVLDQDKVSYKSVTGTTRSHSKVINGKTYTAEKGVMRVSEIKAENNVTIALNQIETLTGYEYGSNLTHGNVVVNAKFTVVAENIEKDLELSVVDDGGFEVTIDNTNREIIIKVKNDPVLTFNITKIDADTKEKLEGAKFKVTSAIQTSATVNPTELNETSKSTNEKGFTELKAGIIPAGKTVIYTLVEDKMEYYDKLDEIIVMVRYDTKGNIAYYEVLSDQDVASIKDGEITISKRVVGETDIPGIVQIQYYPVYVITGTGSRIIELQVKNTKTPVEKDYQVVIEKHHESDPYYPYFISDVTYEITVTQEYGKQKTTWTDITNADGIITSPYFDGHGNITIEIKELTVPDGYKIDPITKTIKLNRNKTTNKLNIITSDVGYEFSEDQTKIILKPINEVSSGIYSILISKTDKNNNVLVTNNPATIEIYKVEPYETIIEKEDEETGDTNYESVMSEIKESIINQDTNEQGRIVVDGLKMPENEGVYKYTIKETKVPEGYVGLEEEAEIEITFTKNLADEMVMTNAVVTKGNNVKIAKVADQLISIVVENEKLGDIVQENQYSLDITKIDKDGNAITEDIAVFKLTDKQTDEVNYFETNEFGRLDIPHFNIPAEEGIYTYVLNEIKAPEGYMLNREDITVTVEFKQDEEGNIFLNTVTVDGQNVVYEKAEEGQLPDTKISIDVINEEGQSGTGNTNSKTYTVLLNKVDSETKEHITENVEFEVTLANGEIVRAATNEQGQIIIENVFMPANPGEYEFVIKELTTPKDYQEDKEMKILKITFEGNGDNMVISNVQLDDTYKNNIEVLTEEMEEDKIVLNVLNVRGNPQLYVVSKEDSNGKDIYEVQGQGYEGRHYYIDKPYIDTKVAKYGSNMTVQEFIDNLESNGTLTILDNEGNELSPEDRVKTGMTLRATLDNQELTFTIIVKGDVDGDGRVRTKDLDALIKHLSGEKLLTDPIAIRAFDLTTDGGDGKIRTTDLNEFYNVMAEG